MIDWSLLYVEPEGEFSPEPLHILDKRVVQLRKHSVVQFKVKWKHFKANKATWENESTMRKAYPALFHDVVSSP